jgi:hypothetical protein
MPTNTDLLKQVSRTALISELIEKSKKCAFSWEQVSAGQYKTEYLAYTFYLTKTGSSSFLLDVIKNASLYRSYNSVSQPEVQELFMMVDVKAAQLQQFERSRDALSVVSTFHNRCPKVFTEETAVEGGGLVASGNPAKYILVPKSVFLLPQTLTFGPAFFPWIGNAADIDDAPNAVMNDDDDSFIRQEVYGAPPTNWGYAYVGFNDFVLPPYGPYSIRTRVAHRREETEGSVLTVAILVDSAIVFSDQMQSELTYSIYDSGEATADVESMEELVIRLNNYSNTGNESPIALRITAVDAQVEGFVRFDDGDEVERDSNAEGAAVSGRATIKVTYRRAVAVKALVSGSAEVHAEGAVKMGGSAFVEKFTP